MEPGIVFLVKEEVLRNVLKTHEVVLVLGWPGTGKTVSTLRAVKEVWKPYYFAAAAIASHEELRGHNAEINFIGNLDELPADAAEDSVLMIDDFDTAPEELKQRVAGFISEKRFKGKIVITAETQPKLDEIGFGVDAVVRMKDDTAQLIYTRLHEIP